MRPHLYKRPCPSLGPSGRSVGLSVGPSVGWSVAVHDARNLWQSALFLAKVVYGDEKEKLQLSPDSGIANHL